MIKISIVMKILLSIFLYLPLLSVFGTTPRVVVDEGVIEGHILETAYGKDYVGFEGIPYAEPPIGNLRFEEPKPKRRWTDVWQANTQYSCLQYTHGYNGTATVTGNEDCLYLNVYKPIEPLTGLDVIVFIHGGAFMFFSGALHSPMYIMDNNVIYITLNYRLGPLGFLSLEDYTLPGNNGLKDQNLALKWIKKNVRKFGGNSDSITLVGMSAGSASTHLHTISPLSKGLMNRAFGQSGVASNPWALVEKAREKALKLADLVGCSSKISSRNLLRCLKSRPGHQIVENVKHFLRYKYNPCAPFGPVVERVRSGAFLPEHPLKIIKKKNIADIPTIFSFVDCEGLYPAADFAYDEILDEIDRNWNALMPYILLYNDTVSIQDMDDVSKIIREEYLKDKQLKMETFDDFVNIISDRYFVKDISDVALLQSKAIKSPVYSYKLSYLGVNGLSTLRAPWAKLNCTSHADDTFFVVPPKDFMRTTEEDAKMSDVLVKIWLSFAKTGVPSVDNVQWEPVIKTNGNLNYLHIKSPEIMEMESVDDLGNPKFWNSLPIEENEKLFTQMRRYNYN